jgi:hypothetical protein
LADRARRSGGEGGRVERSRERRKRARAREEEKKQMVSSGDAILSCLSRVGGGSAGIWIAEIVELEVWKI